MLHRKLLPHKVESIPNRTKEFNKSASCRRIGAGGSLQIYKMTLETEDP
ncbi:MAG: hypothetical protein ONB24_06245 [candidate division KSB1 bacterium]|nr:hypothetical protein [candidate division KSB1 bacterium]